MHFKCQSSKPPLSRVSTRISPRNTKEVISVSRVIIKYYEEKTNVKEKEKKTRWHRKVFLIPFQFSFSFLSNIVSRKILTKSFELSFGIPVQVYSSVEKCVSLRSDVAKGFSFSRKFGTVCLVIQFIKSHCSPIPCITTWQLSRFNTYF